MIRYIFEGWQERLVPIDEVQPHPDNPNNGDLDALVESILTNGCYRPIRVSLRSKRILGGHHIYYAHLRYDMQYVPVDWVEATDDEHEIRIMIADNEITRRGKSVESDLLALAKRLRKNEEDRYAGLIGTGLDEDDYARLIHAVHAPMRFDTTPLPQRHGLRRVTCPTCHDEFEIPKEQT